MSRRTDPIGARVRAVDARRLRRNVGLILLGVGGALALAVAQIASAGGPIQEPAQIVVRIESGWPWSEIIAGAIGLATLALGGAHVRRRRRGR